MHLDSHCHRRMHQSCLYQLSLNLSWWLCQKTFLFQYLNNLLLLFCTTVQIFHTHKCPFCSQCKMIHWQSKHYIYSNFTKQPTGYEILDKYSIFTCSSLFRCDKNPQTPQLSLHVWAIKRGTLANGAALHRPKRAHSGHLGCSSTQPYKYM